MAVDTLFIEAGNRDGFWYSGTVTGLTNLEYGGNQLPVFRNFTGPAPFETIWSKSFMIFDGLNPDIPIISAYLNEYGSFDCSGGAYPDVVIARIYGALVPDVIVPISSATYVGTLPRTVSQVDWTWVETDGCSGTVVTSPNIASILNEVRQQVGFTQDSLFILRVEFISTTIPAMFNGRGFYDFESAAVPYLVITTPSGRPKIRINDEKSPIDLTEVSDIAVDDITIGDRPIRP